MMIAFLKFWTVFKISRPLQIAAGVLASLLAFKAWMVTHDTKVRKDVVTKIERKTDEAVRKAVSAQRRADEPGAADRLRKRYCGDC